MGAEKFNLKGKREKNEKIDKKRTFINLWRDEWKEFSIRQ